MSWNYRVIRTPSDEPDVAHYYGIHEVYYSKKGAIQGWTENPITPLCESVESLREDLRMMQYGTLKPVLEEKVLPSGKRKLKQDKMQPINPGHFIELMDRVHVAMGYLYESVGTHCVTNSHKELAALYETAERSLGELYQQIYKHEMRFKEKNKTPKKKGA